MVGRVPEVLFAARSGIAVGAALSLGFGAHFPIGDVRDDGLVVGIAGSNQVGFGAETVNWRSTRSVGLGRPQLGFDRPSPLSESCHGA